jgi:MarR family transcriptional regulator, organic hydroperoxide resistance regulator
VVSEEGQGKVEGQRPSDQQDGHQLDTDLRDCFFELIGRIVDQGEQLARRLAIPAPFIKVLHTMDCPMAMKELGKRMHCDPSFVTLLADMLEKRGLARREPGQADRRVKNLVLTGEGLTMRQRLEEEISARMPWQRLSDDERAHLLALIRKMLSAEDRGADADQAPSPAEERPGGLARLLFASATEPAPPVATVTPPLPPGR